MRVLVVADGEGISQITDHRECWPAFPQYWMTGRAKFTADVSAAALGLLDGGASEVVVLDGHGLQWKNVLPDRLPDKTRLLMKKESIEDFDLWFNVGAHSSCGTPNGFISHTSVPYLRVALNGALVTETHGVALDMGIQPLGVTGDAALDSQLDGFLQGVPFLPVKRSASRSKTQPLYPSSKRSMEAIRSFAKECLLSRRSSRLVGVPKTIRGEYSFDKTLVDKLEGEKGLVRSSPSVLVSTGRTWKEGAGKGWTAAMNAAVGPFLEAQGDLDLSSEESMEGQDETQLGTLQKYLVDWVESNPSGWED